MGNVQSRQIQRQNVDGWLRGEVGGGVDGTRLLKSLGFPRGLMAMFWKETAVAVAQQSEGTKCHGLENGLPDVCGFHPNSMKPS